MHVESQVLNTYVVIYVYTLYSNPGRPANSDTFVQSADV